MKVEEENKGLFNLQLHQSLLWLTWNTDFLDLVAQGKVFKMQPTQEFAYNMMRGKGLGTQPIFPPPRAPLGVNEDYRLTEDFEEYAIYAFFGNWFWHLFPSDLQSGIKYYKIESEPESSTAAVSEEPTAGIERLAIEKQPRREVVLNFKGDEGETNNHYKGKEVLGNFGYINVHGTWVDPDSEKDLAHAFRGYPSLLPEELDGARAKDPRIMSPAQLEEFYDFFNDYVSDDEGDPRDNRLSQEDFEKMVRGAASEGKGDTWAKAVVAPQVRRSHPM